VHLLCHLDSPLAASLPYLGLQEQTGPEFSGLYGSYKVPSRSSLIPLHTPSPGGVAHRPTSLTQSSSAHSQQSTRNTDKCFQQRFGNHRMISRDDFRASFTHRLAQFSHTITGCFHSSPAQGIRVQECVSGFTRNRHRLIALERVLHSFPQENMANGFRDESGNPAEVVPSAPRDSVQNGGAFFPHSSVQGLYLHAPGMKIVTLGTACIPQRASPLHVPSFARNLG
jgi:hypothetical protein